MISRYNLGADLLPYGSGCSAILIFLSQKDSPYRHGVLGIHMIWVVHIDIFWNTFIQWLNTVRLPSPNLVNWFVGDTWYWNLKAWPKIWKTLTSVPLMLHCTPITTKLTLSWHAGIVLSCTGRKLAWATKLAFKKTHVINPPWFLKKVVLFCYFVQM